MSNPIQWVRYRADLIWPDGPFIYVPLDWHMLRIVKKKGLEND